MVAEEVLIQLLKQYHENKLSHVYLIETNNIDNCFLTIKSFIKQISCSFNYQKDCNKCNICHLIDDDTMPNMIVVRPEGNVIKKDDVEDLKSRLSVKPLYLKHNFYIMLYPELMNSTSYNRMLKFLEEPEENIYGFLITQDRSNIADTIVSRCQRIKITYTKDKTSNDLLDASKRTITDLATRFLELVQVGKLDFLWYNNVVLSKEITNKEQAIAFLQAVFEILNNNKHYNSTLKIVNKYLIEVQYNVNITLMLTSFAVEMEESYEN